MPPQNQTGQPDFYEAFEARRESAKTLLGFSLVYLTGYLTDPPALFHPQLVHSLEDESLRRLLIIGFRGSGKSTFGSLALPLWAALEYPDKFPFIILIADQIITPEDIHYYDEKPTGLASIKGHGIDLAISQKENADYTSIVSGEVFYVDNAPKIFIRPHPYNEHVTFHNFLLKVREIPGELKGANLFFVEDVAYQKAAKQ
jgi:hypothetical protein